MPAGITYYWMDYTGNMQFGNAANWSVVEGSQLIGPNGQIPEAGDSIIFGPISASTNGTGTGGGSSSGIGSGSGSFSSSGSMSGVSNPTGGVGTASGGGSGSGTTSGSGSGSFSGSGSMSGIGSSSGSGVGSSGSGIGSSGSGIGSSGSGSMSGSGSGSLSGSGSGSTSSGGSELGGTKTAGATVSASAPTFTVTGSGSSTGTGSGISGGGSSGGGQYSGSGSMSGIGGSGGGTSGGYSQGAGSSTGTGTGTGGSSGTGSGSSSGGQYSGSGSMSGIGGSSSGGGNPAGAGGTGGTGAGTGAGGTGSASGSGSGSTSGSGSVSPDCYGMVGAGLEYASVTLESGYLGTVFVTGAFESYSYTQQGGTIDQNPSCDITVNESFDWTNGTLNGTSNICNLNLLLGSGYIAPNNEGTIQTGDNINVTSASLSEDPGTLQFLNADNVTVNQGGTLNINAENAEGLEASVVWEGKAHSETATAITLNPESTCIVTGPTNLKKGGPGNWPINNMALVNNSGTLIVQSNATVTITGGGQIPFTQTTDTQYSTWVSPTTILSVGCNLNVTNASILGGTLAIDQSKVWTENGTATLTGNLTLANAKVIFTSPSKLPITSGTTFNVTGNVTVNGNTTIMPKINLAKNGICDSIDIGGSLTIQKATLTIERVISMAQAGQQVPPSFVWTIVSTVGGITNNGTLVGAAIDPTGKTIRWPS